MFFIPKKQKQMQEELKRELAAEMEIQKKKLLMEDPTLRSEMEKLNLIKEQKRVQDEKKNKEERENEKVCIENIR